MNIYYYANQVYQYGHIKPVFTQTGGTFVVNKFNRFLRFKFYMANSANNSTENRSLNTPNVIIRDIRKKLDLNGVIVSCSNTTINNNQDISISIFIGHGAGDKKYGGSAHDLETYDYHFISGEKHLHKLRDVGINIPDEKLIKIGYPKFDEYLNINKDQYLKFLGIKDKTRKNILYAPTWKWGDGTLRKFGKKFCKEISREHNLIIRPHFEDRGYIIRLKLWAKLNGLKHVYFSNPAQIIKNNTMNDFAISDLMISDTSSINYEYLITRKPIIIVDNDYDQLHNMPTDLNILDIVQTYQSNKNDICSMINYELSNNTFDQYNKMLHNCFYFNDGKSANRAADFIKSLEI
ncbi:MAG: CDP-glycerol glycerophosphotransferase family protein [Candidatus Marinimicrobia bacterium]|nr:CDP-glycerol glycerophosphotransferase family protein [Candidatus Neomarinimicrobiota bacterium]